MKVIITGTTGMVGKGVLLECLENSLISEVLVINRAPLNLKNAKLKEVILKDFSFLENIKDKLVGYDAMFHCMGVSAIRLSEEKYNQVTFEITKTLCDILYENNPLMVFNYVSGSGTDSSEKGKIMWARIKGKTENYILQKKFKNAYMFRPGIIIPEKGIKSRTKWYNMAYVVLNPFFGILKKSKNITTTSKLGVAMINSLCKGYKITHLENKEINELAELD